MSAETYEFRVVCKNCGHNFVATELIGHLRPEQLECVFCGCPAWTQTLKENV